jgi:hypothetical protein
MPRERLRQMETSSLNQKLKLHSPSEPEGKYNSKNLFFLMKDALSKILPFII